MTTRKTRQELEKHRKIGRLLKAVAWLAAFCIVVSLIKIASVFALKGEDVEYASQYSLPIVRGLICAHAAIALVAILARHRITLAITLLLTIALFVANLSLPIYAYTSECVASAEQHCQYTLDYHENNIYDF